MPLIRKRLGTAERCVPADKRLTKASFLQDVTFSADHRVVEGVELARLVETWKRIIEEPSRLLS